MVLLDEEKDANLNDFAKRSFRDVADQDYIAARMSYRANLREPFLWSSLQALEKYFKAILLFNRESSKGVSHKLDEALKRVDKSVWHVRQFCYCQNESRTIIDERNRHKFAIQGGFLEKIIKNNHDAAKFLIWHNFYYGRRRTDTIKKPKIHMSSVNPTLVMHPEIFEELDKLVTISRETQKYFKQINNNN